MYLEHGYLFAIITWCLTPLSLSVSLKSNTVKVEVEILPRHTPLKRKAGHFPLK